MKTAFIAYLATGAFGLASHAYCQAQDAKPEHAIKEDVPRTGSSILRTGVGPSAIAINKRYHELSAEDRAYLHGLWESMPEGDEPPFPAKGLKPVHNAMYKLQAKLEVEGELHLLATVDSQGNVEEVKAFGSPSPEMTQYAAAVVLGTKFKPAICSGQPCRRDFRFSYRFGAKH